MAIIMVVDVVGAWVSPQASCAGGSMTEAAAALASDEFFCDVIATTGMEKRAA